MQTISEIAHERIAQLNEAISSASMQDMEFHVHEANDLHSSLYETLKLADRLDDRRSRELRNYVLCADEAAKVLFDCLSNPAKLHVVAARTIAANLASEVVDYLALLTEAKSTPRTRRKRTIIERPLTPRQTQALELFAKHGGKLSEVARELGVKHPTAHKILKSAWSKIPNIAPRKTARRGRTRNLGIGRRGQFNV